MPAHPGCHGNRPLNERCPVTLRSNDIWFNCIFFQFIVKLLLAFLLFIQPIMLIHTSIFYDDDDADDEDDDNDDDDGLLFWTKI